MNTNSGKSSNGAEDCGRSLGERICNECGRPFQLRINPPFRTAKRKYCSVDCLVARKRRGFARYPESKSLKNQHPNLKTTMLVAHKRRERVFRLHEKGLTNREIGQKLGVSASRIYQILCKRSRLLNEQAA